MTGRSHAMVERDNQMAKLTAEGLTRKQIADRLRVSAATVIQSNGKPKRFVLTQPPGYRRGSDALPVVGALAQGTAKALANARNDRDINSKSNGTRPRAC